MYCHKGMQLLFQQRFDPGRSGADESPSACTCRPRLPGRFLTLCADCELRRNSQSGICPCPPSAGKEGGGAGAREGLLEGEREGGLGHFVHFAVPGRGEWKKCPIPCLELRAGRERSCMITSYMSRDSCRGEGDRTFFPDRLAHIREDRSPGRPGGTRGNSRAFSMRYETLASWMPARLPVGAPGRTI